MPALADTDILRVVNKGEQTFRMMYDSRNYNLVPNEDQFVPFPAIALWFGDPRSAAAVGSLQDERGVRTWVPDRETEVRRLRAKYDNRMGDESLIENHPSVEIYTLDNERVYTVLDDPTGDRVIAAVSTVADQRDLAALVAKQQLQIEALTQIVTASQSSGEAGIPTPEPITQPPPIPEPPPIPGASEGSTEDETAFGGTPLSDLPPTDQG